MQRTTLIAFTCATCLGAAIVLVVPRSARAQMLAPPAQPYSSMSAAPYSYGYNLVQPRYYVPGTPYRGTVVGPGYVGPWYTYSLRSFRPRPLFRRGDPTLEYYGPAGRGVLVPRPWLGH